MPALTTLLAAADEAGLQRLAALWGVAAEAAADCQPLGSALAARMRSPFAARSVWRQMPPGARASLWQIVSSKSGARWNLLPKKVKLSATDVDSALDWLQGQGLIAEEIPRQPIPIRPEARVPAAPLEPRLVALAECADALALTGAECCTPQGDRSRWELSRLLQGLSWGMLETLAQRCGVRAAPSSTRAPYGFPVLSASRSSSVFDLRVQVQAALEGTAAVFALLHQVPPEGVQLWTWLWEQEEGRATWEATHAALGLDPCALEALLPVLEAHALVFDTLTVEGVRLVFLPASLYRQLQPTVAAWQADERALALVPLEAPPHAGQGGPPVLLYDLAVLIGWMYQRSLEPTKEDALPKRTQALLRPLLQGRPRGDGLGNDVYPNLLLLAARELQLPRFNAKTPGFDLEPGASGSHSRCPVPADGCDGAECS